MVLTGRAVSGPHISAVLANVAADREQAVRQLRKAMPGWLAAHTPIDIRLPPWRDPDAYTDLLCSLHPVGSPAECVTQLHTSEERTGIRHVIMMVESAGTREHTQTNISRLDAPVLPPVLDCHQSISAAGRRFEPHAKGRADLDRREIRSSAAQAKIISAGLLLPGGTTRMGTGEASFMTSSLFWGFGGC
jgi:hypothetical protein